MWLLSALPAPADAGDFEIRLAGQRCLGMRAGRFLGATEQHAVSLVAGADLAEADDVYGVHARRCKVSAIVCQALSASFNANQQVAEHGRRCVPDLGLTLAAYQRHHPLAARILIAVPLQHHRIQALLVLAPTQRRQFNTVRVEPRPLACCMAIEALLDVARPSAIPVGDNPSAGP